MMKQAAIALGAAILSGSFGASAQQPVHPIAGITGGCTPFHLAGGTAASTNATLIKTGTATLCHLAAINTTATVVFLRMYDLAAAPTCGSATGAKHSYPVAASASGIATIIPLAPYGEAYASGLGYCVTGGGTDTDNTNAVTGIFVEGSFR